MSVISLELLHGETLRLTPSLCGFLNAAYGTRGEFKHPERWGWVYQRAGSTLALARSEQMIVGQVGGMGARLRHGAEIIDVAWSVDNMILPEFRGQGIGTALQELSERNTRPTLSTWLSEANCHVKRKIGNRDLCELTVVAASQDGFQHVEKGTLSGIDLSLLLELSATHLASRSDLYIERSAPYLSWRFVEQPFAHYAQLTTRFGVAMMRKCGPMRPGVGMIGDVFSEHAVGRETAIIVNSAAANLFQQGCTHVRYGSTSKDVVECLLSSPGWAVHRIYPILINCPKGQQVSGCHPYFTLSDADLDQFPW
jgi:hypothetical protein